MGFPGWHLECSAMSMKLLGQQFDIHAGGIDHIPVHHTNEIAQSEAATGKKPCVKYWLHGEFLHVKDPSASAQGKMAKSGENFITLQTLKDKGISPLAYRYFVLQTHYRKPLTFSWDALEAAQIGLNRMYETIRAWKNEKPRIGCAEFEANFMDAVNDDLNTPQALAVLSALLKSNYPAHAKKASLVQFEKILGLGLGAVPAETIVPVPDDIQKLLKKRETARNNKNWAESDRLRDEIKKKGFIVEDTPAGQTLNKI
jgi:cysteinyl-tRNA synthetase